MSNPDPTDEMRPIPDGGLKDAMPAWLKRPPAWRTGTTSATERVLPPPDTSPIDPRSLVDVADLPPWLQALAHRADELGERGSDRIQDAANLAQQPTEESAAVIPAAKTDEEPGVIPGLTMEPVPASIEDSPVGSPPTVNLALIGIPLILLILLIIVVYLR